MRALRFVVPLMILVGLSGCGAGKDPAMPDVTGKKLDVAQSDIKRAGFEGKPEVLGGGVFGVIKESNWEVCEQTPAPGELLTKAPRLKVDRGCNKDASPSEEPSSKATEKPDSPPTTISDIRVDALLDKLNSANMGGIKLGDQFRMTAELFEEDAWGVGATGEYSVHLQAKGGNDDLLVFVDQSDAAGWHNGTKVEMVVRVEERTVDGETSGGWLKA